MNVSTTYTKYKYAFTTYYKVIMPLLLKQVIEGYYHLTTLDEIVIGWNHETSTSISIFFL